MDLIKSNSVKFLGFSIGESKLSRKCQFAKYLALKEVSSKYLFIL